MASTLLLFASVGATAGLLAGLFGIGGGVILVPMLVAIFTQLDFSNDVIMHMAIGTSLTIMVITASIAAMRHHHLGSVRWKAVKALAPTLIVGAFIGTQLADLFNTTVLQALFCGFLLFTACNIALTFRNGNTLYKVSDPRRRHYLIMGLFIGIVSGMLGIGGGVLLVPWLLHVGYNGRQSAGSASACTLLIALSGMLGMIIAGSNESGLPAHSFSFIYLPAVACVAFASALTAPLGVHLSYRLPQKWLAWLFSTLLICIAIKMGLGLLPE